MQTNWHWRHRAATPEAPRVSADRRAAEVVTGTAARVRGYVLAGILLLIGAWLIATSAAAQNYGAIAYSPSTRAHGWAYDYPSRRAAESAALGNCRKQAGDCSVPLWFRNGCGALAIGANGYGTGWGTSRRLAESNALRTCRRFTGNCSVVRWVCTTR